MTLAEVDALIATYAANPKRVQGDMGEVEQHSLKDLLELRAQLTSSESSLGGITIKKLNRGPTV